jgi:hypothetical protein
VDGDEQTSPADLPAFLVSYIAGDKGQAREPEVDK